jgi:hypothetical protein
MLNDELEYIIEGLFVTAKHVAIKAYMRKDDKIKLLLEDSKVP